MVECYIKYVTCSLWIPKHTECGNGQEQTSRRTKSLNIQLWHGGTERMFRCMHDISFGYIKQFHSRCQPSLIFIKLLTSAEKLPEEGKKNDVNFIGCDILHVVSLAALPDINFEVQSCKLKTLKWFICGYSESLCPVGININHSKKNTHLFDSPGRHSETLKWNIALILRHKRVGAAGIWTWQRHHHTQRVYQSKPDPALI